ncbi:MAG: glycosyltransferase family 2 protein [Paludibacteraceae bacterium]
MISVVIPLYNKAQSVKTTLLSVLAQTYTDYEVIIVDDGSTDGSGAICDEYLQSQITNHKSSILKVFHQSNSGVSAARNTGIREAKGEYVAFLDADDCWEPDFLSTMAKLIADYPGRSIYGLGCEQLKRGERISQQGDFYRGVSTWSYDTMAFTGSSACANKADAVAAGLFDTRMTHGEDLDMWWRLMLMHGGASDKRPYAYYIQDAENRAMHRIAPLEKHIPYYTEKYAEARAQNAEFRKFFDTEMIYRLYPYLFDRHYRKEAQRIAKFFDYSQLKWTMRFRMEYPYLYRIYQKITGK